MSKQDYSFFKDATLITVVTYRYLDLIKLGMQSILDAMVDRPNTYLVIIDNNSDPEIGEYVQSLASDTVFVFRLPFNFGRGLASNFFLKEYVSKENLPKTIVAIDPDITFSKDSFDAMVVACENIEKAGMIGMRYTKNACNPERNLFFKPKTFKGKNNKDYQLSIPFMCTVPGGIFAVPGHLIMNVCNNQLFPKKYIKTYGGDDSALYKKLRWRYINGYVEGTEATHLRSGSTICLPDTHKTQPK